jgi:hypothetical protein
MVEFAAAVVSLRTILGKKNIPYRIPTSRGEFDSEQLARDSPKKFVWDRHQDPSTITRVLLATTGAAMVHVPQNRIGVENDLVTRCALDVRDEPNAARIFLQLGIVETLFSGKSERDAHKLNSLCTTGKASE